MKSFIPQTMSHCPFHIQITANRKFMDYSCWRQEPFNNHLYSSGKISFETSVAYTPSNSYTQEIMKYAMAHMNLTRTIPFVSRANMTSYMESEKKMTPLAGVVFDSNEEQLPKKLTVTLIFPAELRNPSQNASNENWMTDTLFPLFSGTSPRNLLLPDGGSPPGYYREHFTSLQHCINTAIILMRTKLSEDQMPDVYIQRFSDPKMRIDSLTNILQFILPLIMFLTFLYPVFNYVKVRNPFNQLQFPINSVLFCRLSPWRRRNS